ncbi:MAG TPA: DUF4062 domain-containing protein [Longimicrobium sp.]|nr:DUF4062 domain-containing protein [Longimicrobium sp.]
MPVVVPPAARRSASIEQDPSMTQKRIVVISSTVRDLPEHRAKVMDACLRAEMFPKMMEHLPAKNEDAIQASHALVDEADVYVGIFAHRYGHVPEGSRISITQMEYERAVERGIPRLLFLWDTSVPIREEDIDFENKTKLDALKARMKKERVVAFFNSPGDLRGLVLHSLHEVRKQLDAGGTGQAGQPTGAAPAESVHHVSAIPRPPEPYIPHPYTLLQVHGLVGRTDELQLLTDWVTGRRGLHDVRIFNVVAMGGVGKSALTWTWFNDVAPRETKLAGRMWWSFYESDATFENLVTRAVAYVGRRTLEEVKELPFPDRQALLLRILDREPFLLVLDGLERVLTAYARQDAASLRDRPAVGGEGARSAAAGVALPHGRGESVAEKYRPRTTADPRVGRFLRRLARAGASRVLISTRLYPADLQAPGRPSPGSFALSLQGSSDRDALDLWRAYGASGSSEEILPFFRTFDKHPLLIQLLAYEVAEFSEAPGDFDAWRRANPDFNPFGLDLANVQSHVLSYAMAGLSAKELRTLRMIAVFRTSPSIESIQSLLVRADDAAPPGERPFASLDELRVALSALEGRGLIGRERPADRYHLDPIVRGVVLATLDDASRTELYRSIERYFEAIPVKDYTRVESLDDLAPAIELFHVLVGQGRYDDALVVFSSKLVTTLLYRLSAGRLQVELLNALLPDGWEAPMRLSPAGQSYTLNALAQGLKLSGQPGDAVPIYRRADEIDTRANDPRNRRAGLSNLSIALRLVGKIGEAEHSARAALIISREQREHVDEGISLQWLGMALATRGQWAEGQKALCRSLRIRRRYRKRQGMGQGSSYVAQLALWRGDAATARRLAEYAWKRASIGRGERDCIRAARLQGHAALHLGDHDTASSRLHHALLRARTADCVEEELPTLIALAESHRQQGEAAHARELLDDVWDSAERGPYPLFHTDALNLLAQIERDAGNRDAAVEAATKAYRLAWCDGPPFAYHWGLEKAKAHLAALGAPEPEMPPFDASQHEPMPEVEINPPDEFGGEE